MAAWAYILKCADGSYYVGCTTHLLQRFGQHQAGEVDGYAASRRPVEMVWSEEFPSIDQAIVVERQLKGWSRLKKEAVIRGDFGVLHALAKKGFQTLYVILSRKRSERVEGRTHPLQTKRLT